METKDLSLKIDATKIEVAGIKNKFTAQCKLAYSFIATIATIFATIYSDGKQLVIFSMLLFVFPSFIESFGIVNENKVITAIVKIYKYIFFIVSLFLFIIFVWYFYDKQDAYNYTKVIGDILLIVSIFINLVYSLISYLNLRYNINEHIALAAVEQSTLEKQKERLHFQDNIKKAHKKVYREFVSKQNKDKKGKDK
ncbi:hypothetical protein ACO1ML_11675 [Staphylococcus aureus]